MLITPYDETRTRSQSSIHAELPPCSRSQFRCNSTDACADHVRPPSALTQSTATKSIVSGRHSQVAGRPHDAPAARLPKPPAGTCRAETVRSTFQAGRDETRIPTTFVRSDTSGISSTCRSSPRSCRRGHRHRAVARFVRRLGKPVPLRDVVYEEHGFNGGRSLWAIRVASCPGPPRSRPTFGRRWAPSRRWLSRRS